MNPRDPIEYASCLVFSSGTSKYHADDQEVHCDVECPYKNRNEEKGTCKTQGLVHKNQIPDPEAMMDTERQHILVRMKLKERAPTGIYQT